MWQEHLRKEAVAALEQLEKDSDRAVAIVGASMVERHLEDAIKRRLVNDRAAHKKLGSFSAKINLAYRLGAFSEDAYRELHLIRDIRNDFAHKLEIVDFDSPSVADSCTNLRFFTQYIYDASESPREKSYEEIRAAKYPQIGFYQLAERLKKPRDRFVVCAQAHCTLLAYCVPPIAFEKPRY